MQSQQAMFARSPRRTVRTRSESSQPGQPPAEVELNMSPHGIRVEAEVTQPFSVAHWPVIIAESASDAARVALIILLAVAAITALTFTPVGAASNIRFYIASQYSWEQKVGFYLDLEGAALSQLPLILGVGDGAGWRYPQCAPGFVTDRDYKIRAVIAPGGAQLFLDGRLVGESPGTWQPASGRLEVNYRPQWASQGEWLAMVRGIAIIVTRAGQQITRREFDFSRSAARPAPLQLFEPGDPGSAELEIAPGDTVTIDVDMRFGNGDLKRWAPFIDRYGQCRYAEWPEKVRSDDDLRGDIAREDAELGRMPPSADYDQYGGYEKAGWRERATGFFRVIRRKGYWWLITPAGNPCFYTGACVMPAQTWPTTPITEREFLFEWLPPREEPWSAAWMKNAWGMSDGTEYACLYACNLIRKYGAAEWREKAEARAVRRMRAWGFSGGGKWGAPAGLVSAPGFTTGAAPRLVRHCDVFDPQVCEKIRQELERVIAPRRDDPTILGWSLGNEWDEIVTRSEVTGILGKSAETPAKRAFVDYAVDELYGGSPAKVAAAWEVNATDRAGLYASEPTPPAVDVEKLRRLYADRYYGFIYRTVKELDPNHLFLGFWIIPEWWEDEEDWRLIARHCDVIGYDRYNRDYDSAVLRRLQAETDKPTLCGEFGFPAFYEGQRGFGRYGCWSRDDAEMGNLYYRWVQAAAMDPYCVGTMIFEYRDQPLTGRGPGRGQRLTFNEHFAFGLVTETDRPKWPMVRRAREANLNAAQWRLAAAAK
jgi:hypothetical protein